MLSTKDPPQNERYTRLKIKGYKNNISCKLTYKKAGVTILISHKMNLKTKITGKKNNEGHHIMIKGSI